MKRQLSRSSMLIVIVSWKFHWRRSPSMLLCLLVWTRSQRRILLVKLVVVVRASRILPRRCLLVRYRGLCIHRMRLIVRRILRWLGYHGHSLLCGALRYRAILLRQIIGVERLEPAVWGHHCLQRPRVKQLGLANNPVHHVLGGCFRLRLHEAHDTDVAPDLDILAKIEPIRRDIKRVEPKLTMLWRLYTRLVPGDAISNPHVYAERGVDVRL